MKKYFTICSVLLCMHAFSQNSLTPYPLEVTRNKTTTLIFPYAIISVDRGSADILVQKATATENVLLVKAAKENFAATNLSVITADGKLYPFNVTYSKEPALQNLSFARDARFIGNEHNQAYFEKQAAIVLAQPPFLNCSDHSDKIRMTLNRVYTGGELLWMTFEIQNHSLINYHPAYFKFFIRDKHKTKRTAEQETEWQPLFRVLVDVIRGKGRETFVFAFAPFPIPKGKQLICEVDEKAGSRPLVLAVKHRLLLQARALRQ